MKYLCYLILFGFLFVSVLNGKTLYVSTTGSDTLNGTIDQPFNTITKALASSIVPGDSIIVRGGVYTLKSTITINTNVGGKQDTLCYLLAYPGERPFLDFSTEAYGSKGLQVKGKYWYIKGFDIASAGDNGIYISGSFNIVEFCTVSKNQDSGMQLSGGANNNKIINCDSFFNQDPSEGNSDGFSPKLDVGNNNYFYGCRSWQNTDDGFDGYLRPSNNINTTLDNCWSFMNGYRRDWTLSTGNGNGFKMGGSDNKLLEHNFTLYNCLSFDNKSKGFDQNNNKGSITLINCTGYRNGAKNYSVITALDSGKVLTVTNCLVYGPMGTLVLAVLTTDSWMLPDSVTNSDFVSIDTAGVRGPRKSDGSLPDVAFMHLNNGTHLVNSGTIIPGRPYNGKAPDLGCFETNDTLTSIKTEVNHKVGYYLSNNYPNPFNPSTIIAYQVPVSGHVTLTVFNALGKKVETLVNEEKNEGTYYINFNAVHLASGIYFYNLKTDNYAQTKKMILLK
ncbi:MAG: right-handed parallel beta-helix repeat-containing protein [Ignavibacteriaceae bacterium]|nr:right-handed parallel beta-helix repeat-containing protein [Ignavibacteriaceae bacterium]